MRYLFLVAIVCIGCSTPEEDLSSDESLILASPDRSNGEDSKCVDFSFIKKGQLFRLYQDEVDCTSEAAKKPPLTDVCYRRKEVLTLASDPKELAPNNWELDFRLTSDEPETIRFTMNAATGEVSNGVRTTGTNESPMLFDQLKGTKVKTACERGDWYGRFSGERFLFRMLRNPQTNERIHGNTPEN